MVLFCTSCDYILYSQFPFTLLPQRTLQLLLFRVLLSICNISEENMLIKTNFTLYVISSSVLCSIFLLLFTVEKCKAILLKPEMQSQGTYRSHSLENIHKSRVLDPSVNLILEWNVERNSESILFRISAKFITHITIGFTKKGEIDGGDFLVLGVDYNGTPYIRDMHGVNNETLIQDAKQDWKIVFVDRADPYDTIISISRDLDTCDKEDVGFNGDLTHVVWDYDFSNTLQQFNYFHFAQKGIMPIYLLDPEIPPVSQSSGSDLTSLQKWTFSRTIRLPARHTSYWCSIQRAPVLFRKHHIIGFSAHFRDALSEKHVHHQNTFRCVAPPGEDPQSVFERFVHHPGDECYLSQNPILPVHLCRQVFHLWGVGGTEAALPEDIGFPLGEERYEYYMLETHYDNPEVREDLVIENGVNFYYTPQLRPNDAGMIFVGYGVISDPTNGGLFAVPPQTEEFKIAGQCSPQCTSEILSDGPMEVFAVTLHAHVSTLRMRLRHFRNGQELPPIQRDENFDFNFQQVRLLRKPVTILPGDHLISECVYGTTWKNGSTVSGFSTKDEMCNAFMYINKRVPYMHCSSEFPSDRITSRFGIQNMTWELNSFERVVTSAESPNIVGLKFSEVVNQVFWTNNTRRELEEEMLNSYHYSSCPTIRTLGSAGLSTSIPLNGQVLHPQPAYQPATSCQNKISRLITHPQETSLAQPEVAKGSVVNSGHYFPTLGYIFNY